MSIAQVYFSMLVQRRVVNALVLRELITRYDRHNIGFLWLFAEPILFAMGIVLVRSTVLGANAYEFSLAGFLVTGYLSYILFRNVSNRLSKSISANTALLYHRNIIPLDFIISRFVIEFLGMSGAFIVVVSGLIIFNIMSFPVDLTRCLEAWILLAWFSLACGLIITFLSEASFIFDRIWPMVLLSLLPFSGVFFMVSWMPPSSQYYLLWSPLTNGIEMLRDAFFGPSVHAIYSVSYLLKFNVTVTFLGLILLKRLPAYLEAK